MGQLFEPYDPDQGLLLPPTLRDWLPEGHLAHFVSDTLDQLDLRVFNLHLAEGPDQDVRGPEVAVHDSARVGVGHRLADGLEHVEQLAAIERVAAAEERGQRAALGEFHREVRPLVGHEPELVDRHHARVLELPADLRLLDEAPLHVRAPREVCAQHLQRDVAAELGVARPEDHAHPAARDLAPDPVVRMTLRRPRLRAAVRVRAASPVPADRTRVGRGRARKRIGGGQGCVELVVVR